MVLNRIAQHTLVAMLFVCQRLMHAITVALQRPGLLINAFFMSVAASYEGIRQYLDSAEMLR